MDRVLLALALVAPAPGGGAPDWSAAQEEIVVATPSQLGQLFGYAIAVSGDQAVVGAINDKGFRGSARVLRRDGSEWSEVGELIDANGEVNDHLGYSVAIYGDTAVASAPFDDDLGSNAGAVFVFVDSGSGWLPGPKLAPAAGLAGDNFGESVGLFGDTLAIGAVGDDERGSNAGAVYVFERSGSTWVEVQKLLGSDTDANDQFGISVAVEGERILVGAHGANQAPTTGEGAAYVFRRAGTLWGEEARLLAPDAEAGDLFGGAVALSGDTALVGAWGEETFPVLTSGAAYAYRRVSGVWVPEQKLRASVPDSDDHFGYAVALRGDTAVVGARNEGAPVSVNSGAAYVFERSGSSWNEEVKLVPSDARPQDNFGAAVAVFGDTILVGARYADHACPGFLSCDSGAVYTYLAPTPPAPTYCTAGTSASGCQALLSATGFASAGASSGFALRAVGVEGGKDGLFYFGSNGRQANPWGSGSSYQCVVPPVRRGGLLSASGTPSGCDGAFRQDLNSLWCATCPKPQHNPGAGATVQAQLWYRDPQNTSNRTTSLSGAVEFCVGP